jgi:hypothetical protein
MSHTIGLMIESIVAGLLVVTIGYCLILNKRLVRLKADEMSLKATISELITATEIAERAVAGLKSAVRDCDRDIGDRLRAAERFSVHVAQQIKAGEDILARLARIAVATQTGKPDAPTPAMLPPVSMLQADAPDPNAMLAAAKAFAERARARVTNAAA